MAQPLLAEMLEPNVPPDALPDPDQLLRAGRRPADPDPESYTPGCRRDFDRLYRCSYQRVLYTVLAVVRDYQAAEDCTQEAFARALEHWKNWRPDAPAEAWVHRIALNVAVSYWRWRKLRRVGEVLRRLGGAPNQVEDPDLGLRSDVAAALRTLPPEQAAAIVLRYQHGYTNREIAVAQGVPESTVGWRLAAARDRLREQLT